MLLFLGFGVLGYLLRDFSNANSISIKGDRLLSEFEQTIAVNNNKDESQETSDEVDILSLLQTAFQNEDVVGYLYFPEAGISYPIVQGIDNSEYLRRDIYGNYSVSGSIFLDYENAADFSDVSSIIYGHHMRNGSMFGSLESSLSGSFKGKQFNVYTRDKKLT